MVRLAVTFAIFGLMWIGGAGCSEPPTGESAAGNALSDVAPVEQILGFEDVRLWSGAEALRLSTVHSEGSFSLAVRPSGRSAYRSATFALPASMLRQLAIDLRIPSSATSAEVPARAGTLSLMLASPSRGVPAGVGGAGLTGRPTGVFTTVELDVPAAVAQRLNGGADDLRILVLLEVPR